MVNYDIAHSKAVHKYLLKAFYNNTNKKEYNLQIRKHNIYHKNIIAMKNMLAVTEKNRKNEEQLAMENILNKSAMAEVIKVSNVIDLGSKYSWAISNTDIDVAKDLGLTGMKKYRTCTGQIQAKVDWLHKG